MENRQKIDSKKIFVMLVLVLSLVVVTSGATYAYFAISATAANNITGTAANVGLNLTVTPATLGGSDSGTTQTNVMVPQYDTAIGTAIGNDFKCIDGAGNTVCKVYTITITNSGGATVDLTGTITFASNTNGVALSQNLKWRRLGGTTTLSATTTQSYAQAGVSASTSPKDLIAGTACTVATGSGCASFSLNPGASENFYIVVWISETDNNQYSADGARSFVATIDFNASNGKGVTSTITS